MKFRMGLMGSNRRQSSEHVAPSPTKGGARSELIRAVMLVVSICFGGLFPVANVVADPPRYRIIVIDLPSGTPAVSHMDGLALNKRGEVVGANWGGESVDSYPFVWLPTAHYGLPPGSSPLPLGEDGNKYVPRDINVNGFAIGRASEVGDYVTASWYWNLNTGDKGIIEVITTGAGAWKEEAFALNDADPAVVVGHTWDFAQNEEEEDKDYGYRKVLGGSYELLDLFMPSHINAWPRAVANSGLAVGSSFLTSPECGEEQDVFRATTWASNSTSPDNLVTLGTAQAEAFTVPQGVNNASPNMIVGQGGDPNDISDPCRMRALFWASASSSPVILPFLVVNSQPVTQDYMRALAIAEPFANGTVRVVGDSSFLAAAVLWQRVNNTWQAIDLNDVTLCGGDQWHNLATATDINSCGWIVGSGTLSDTNHSPRGFVLIPVEACPGDIGGGSVQYPNGKVDIDDLLTVVGLWGTSNCVADITGDSTVNIDDLLAVIGGWGACSCFPTQDAPESLSQTLTGAGLTMSDWNSFVNVMASGTQSEKENYNCWMQRYLSECTRCPSCPSNDPFQ